MLGLTQGSQVSIDNCRYGTVMAEVDLELAEVFALLQQMCRVRVAKRMNMSGLFDAAGAQSQSEASLQRSAAHRSNGGGSTEAVVTFGRKEPAWMAVGAPDLA